MCSLFVKIQCLSLTFFQFKKLFFELIYVFLHLKYFFRWIIRLLLSWVDSSYRKYSYLLDAAQPEIICDGFWVLLRRVLTPNNICAHNTFPINLLRRCTGLTQR